MSAHTANAMHKMVHEIDPAEKIKADLSGHIDKYKPLFDGVICAIYIRPEKTVGGIILPNSQAKEDVYQGNVGLVVATGPDVKLDKHGVEVGQWVVFKPDDGRRFALNGVQCRDFDVASIRAIITHPDVVF